MSRQVLLGLTLALLGAGCLGDDGGGSSAPVSKGQSLVLSKEDVGSEFTQFDRGPQQRSDFGPPRDDPKRFGRQGGWKARFSRQGTPRTDGPLIVSSLADVFGSEDGARDDFELYKESLADFSAAGGREISVSDLGDEAQAVTYRQGLRPNATDYYVIVWREGSVTASVNVSGFRLTWPQALALAQAQQDRIRSAAS
jgi:hypothetical protein